MADFLILVGVLIGAVAVDWALWDIACATAKTVVKTDDYRKPFPLWLKMDGAAYRIGLGMLAWEWAAILGLWRPINDADWSIWSVILLVTAYSGVAYWQFWKALTKFYKFTPRTWDREGDDRP